MVRKEGAEGGGTDHGEFVGRAGGGQVGVVVAGGATFSVRLAGAGGGKGGKGGNSVCGENGG